ncbi:hypothetical protein [Pseudomonas syringae]|uniref:Uncharacterized protein n=1 Tax=Pseudomonas syringae pv. pisi str. 1704B TaxID=629263 RepID=F3GDL5_PSESJ|nr:hypothetical protein [Pseudomonas syringae]EGH45165.1 hypothetical protein PSYPI_23679 [Pseudomonas syringae pv. pisi str. 1704B]PYD13896.1 hypothetical protein DND62_10950 [Pseudomonas syringae pv. pisi]PYD32184.1 hypothetical protein DND58_07635 [Pseudomonas syringae pv. pisi]PYD35064.1 hypothetical protein DND67_07520 [Pseudomonas syringae pv. pisi]
MMTGMEPDQRSGQLFKNSAPYPGLFVGLAGVLVLIAFLAPMYSDWFLWLKPVTDTSQQWFERSGAITTIFGLLAINLVDSGVERLVPSRKLADVSNVHLYTGFEYSFMVMKALAFLTTIAGTFIWGYGTVILNIANRAA